MDRSKLPAHAKYGPSSMARIMACPGSVALCENAPPEPPSEYAEDGTRAHARAEQLIYDGESEIECEDPWAVDAYIAYANALIDECEASAPDKDAAPWGAETLLVYSHEHFGTTDLWALVGRTLHIIDYKHGAGVKVYPENNIQALTYAALLFADDEMSVGWDDVDDIVITIAQPRAHGGNPIEHWNTTPDAIREHIRQVEAAIEKAESEFPPVVMGEHCRFCKAKLICPAIKAAEHGIAKWDSKDIESGDLTEMLNQAAVVEEKIKALYKYAHSRLEAGEKISGWKLVNKQARKSWTDEDELRRRARRLGVITKLWPQKVVSPAQAGKVLTPGELARLDDLIEARSSGTTIKPASSPAPEVETPMAALAALGSIHR